MAKCLGLYIEKNIIKYAKVSKERDSITVESFGVKFYDKIGEAINQIVEETYSYKTPISVNLSEEMYNYFNMFSLLNKEDLNKAIKIEFESFCSDKGYNPNVFETRSAISNFAESKERIKVIHVSSNKIELSKRIQQLEGYKVGNISPISMSISNLINPQEVPNSLIVNIEEKTTITTIIDKQINDISIVEHGSKDILDKINLKENSYSKSYEICKNTTIYTSEGKELQEVEASYLEDVMPTLYEIVGQVRKIINETTEKIERVYLTGTGSLVNNIDLYFEEYLTEIKCEVLKPYFIVPSKDINTKDYMEVNSAISLGLMGLNEGIAGMNFRKSSFNDKIPDWMKIEVGGNKNPQEKNTAGGFFTYDLGEKLDKTEVGLLRVVASLLLIVVIYSVLTGLINTQINEKNQEAQASISDTNSQIALANSDNDKIKTKTNEYTTMIKNLQDINDKITNRNRTRNVIPNLLNQIMNSVPQNVQITAIQNTSGSHIEIDAQSVKYEQLGYLIARIKNDVILTNVISTAGQKENNIVTVKIEGDIP